MPTIVAVSGQPTKNLGATIINAGNTPAGVDGTTDATNNPSFGTLLGSNTGKSSGSQVVESAGTASSGVGGSIPGIQKTSTKQEQEFASTTVGATISKTLTTGENQIGKATVGWKNIVRQYPTFGSPTVSSKYKYEYAYSAFPPRPDDNVPYIKRGEVTEFGSSVQIAKRTAGGIIIAAGAPSGWHPQTEGGRAGYVDAWEHDLETMPGIPGEVGTLTNKGFAQVDEKYCSFRDVDGVGMPQGAPPSICPGHLNGFQRIRNRILYKDETHRASDVEDKRHTITASGVGVGHSIAFNADGSRMAVGMPYAQDEKGEVRVYEFCNVPTSGNYWFRLGSQMTGNQKGDRFGWSVAMEGSGNSVFVGAPRPKGSGYVSRYRLNGYGGSAAWNQQASASTSGVEPGDKYGFSVTCNRRGDVMGVGAPDGSGTRGYAQMFAYLGGSWRTTKRANSRPFAQSMQTTNEVGKIKMQRIVGEASGERLGWSIDAMYEGVPSVAAGKYNIRVAVGSPYWSSSVAGYDFSKRTFAERAAGVPIFDGVSIFSGAGGGFNPVENGLEFQTKGLTSEGRVTCWGYSGEAMLQTKKYGFATLEYIQFGKSSSKEIMKGSRLSELGYSVKISDEGDFIVAGAPGTDTSLPDDSDCQVKSDASKGKGGEDDPGDPTIPPPVNPGDPCQPGILVEPPSTLGNYNLGTGEVRVYRYLWKGSDGDDARTQHYREEEDYFIKYGATVKGIEVPEHYRMAMQILPPQLTKNNHRYRRPNFQNFGQGDSFAPRYYDGERFGTSVGVFAQFKAGDTIIPQLVVGAPFAVDEEYRFDRCVFDPCEEGMGTYNPGRTGRIDAYVALPTFGRDNVMPMGAGRTAGFGRGILGRRTKPKLNYAHDGTPILGSGTAGGRESFFIAPNVSGSGLANDNALKTSRKTFNSGGINFTSSD